MMSTLQLESPGIKPFMDLLQKNLLIRYLVSKKDPGDDDIVEINCVTVLYAGKRDDSLYETLYLHHIFNVVPDIVLVGNLPLHFVHEKGDESVVEAVVTEMLAGWSNSHEAHQQWLKHEAFVGVLNVGKTVQDLNLGHPEFSFLTGLLMGKFTEYHNWARQIKEPTNKQEELLDVLDKMILKFKQFLLLIDTQLEANRFGTRILALSRGPLTARFFYISSSYL